jgi:DNA-directed RNA polymerase subunit M/transcription elongation factor TFIIS
MYFCPKCNYSFDISKNVAPEKPEQAQEDTRKKLDNIDSALKRLKAGKLLTEYKAEFSLEDLEANNDYIKLDDDEKDKMKTLFNSVQLIGGIIFKCNNCNYKKKINETIRLYQLNVDSVYSVYRSMDDNKLLFLNPIYPRTHDYNCKNINCISHKDETNKEAVFFREKDSYLTNYICGVCYSSWKV